MWDQESSVLAFREVRVGRWGIIGGSRDIYDFRNWFRKHLSSCKNVQFAPWTLGDTHSSIVLLQGLVLTPSKKNFAVKLRRAFGSVFINRMYRVNVQYLRFSCFVMQSRTTTVIHSYLKTSAFISYYSRCSFFPRYFLSFFFFSFILCLIPYFWARPHCMTVFLQSETRNWLFVC
jgi:hypothetical protein